MYVLYLSFWFCIFLGLITRKLHVVILGICSDRPFDPFTLVSTDLNQDLIWERIAPHPIVAADWPTDDFCCPFTWLYYYMSLES